MEDKGDLILTLGYWFRDSDKEILLGFKKEGFGKDKWNGVGGKVKIEKSELIYFGFLRETEEESSLIVRKAEKRGFLRFYFIEDPIFRHCHIYKIIDCDGELKESNEMIWQWFPVDKIPFDQMWPADRYWMPFFLTNKKFSGNFFYRDTDLLLGYDELKEVENLDE
jgi:8-oxo-dGTP diphosphatase / 2-hydroxy-dATP diphosphatase